MCLRLPVLDLLLIQQLNPSNVSDNINLYWLRSAKKTNQLALSDSLSD